jgi:hypothetical protein
MKDVDVNSIKSEFDKNKMVQLAVLLWLNRQRVDTFGLPAKVSSIVSKACDNPHVRYATLGAVVKVAKMG